MTTRAPGMLKSRALPVNLVAQAVVERQIRCHVPVVLTVNVKPGRPPLLGAAADADLCRARIAKQEIAERIARKLTREVEGAACRVWQNRLERQMKEVRSGLHLMCTAIPHDVVIQLDAAVRSRYERRRIANRIV